MTGEEILQLLEYIIAGLLSYAPYVLCCCGIWSPLLIALGIWGIITLIHKGDRPPKPSAKERWYDVAQWFLIIVGVVGTAVSIIGGLILVALYITPCIIIYLIMPGPAHTGIAHLPSGTHQPDRSISSGSSDDDSSNSSSSSSRYSDYDFPPDDHSDDEKDNNYNPSFFDGWWVKYGTYDDDEKDD